MQLDGERAPRVATFEFRSLPSGVYDVRAILKGADGKPRAMAESTVNVMESALSHRGG